MNDGGMGSLYFYPERVEGRRLGRSLVEASFLDKDGIEVRATVNLDTEGNLLELDLWKVDFLPLQSLPEAKDIVF